MSNLKKFVTAVSLPVNHQMANEIYRETIMVNRLELVFLDYSVQTLFYFYLPNKIHYVFATFYLSA